MASQINIEIKGQEKLGQIARNAASIDVGAETDKALLQAGAVAERGIKQALTTGPTRALLTGYLRASVRINQFQSKRFIAIGPNTTYALMIHEGTRSMRPRPYVKVASQNIQPELEQIAEKTGVKLGSQIVKGV